MRFARWPGAAGLLAGGAVPGRVRVTATRVPGSGSAARAGASRGRCAPYQAAQRVIVLAGHAALPQRLRMDGTKHRSALGVRDGDLDPDQARCVDDDAIERAAFPNQRHELAFVEEPHAPDPTRGPARRCEKQSCSSARARSLRSAGLTAASHTRPQPPIALALARPRDLLSANDKRDARQIDPGGVVDQQLGERRGGQSRRANGVRMRAGAENEGDRQLVGADGLRTVPVISTAEVAAQPVIEDRA